MFLRIIILAFVCTALLIPSVSRATEWDHPTYLSLTAQSIDQYALNSVVEDSGVLRLSVHGGRKFRITPIYSHPAGIKSLAIAFSDGKLYDLPEGTFDYRGDFLIAYYGLIIANYNDGAQETLPFYFTTCWYPKQLKNGEIPEIYPDVVKPDVADVALQAKIDQWWTEDVTRHEAGLTNLQDMRKESAAKKESAARAESH
jgi:hypothetical protein